MLRVAIVDDEAIFIERFQKLVQKNLALQNIEFEIHAFSDSLKFRETYLQCPFDLIFLDIDMPHLSGIQIAADLRRCNLKCSLIFVSAHNHFVFESIHYAPFRFIRKEHVEEETAEAIQTFCELLETEQNHIRLEMDNGRSALFNVSQIAFFYTLRHSLFLCNSRKESQRLAVRSYTMEKLEEMMKPYGFIRIHKSYLLNYSYIYQIQTDHVLLIGDEQENTRHRLPLSRRRTSEVREYYRMLLREEAVL